MVYLINLEEKIINDFLKITLLSIAIVFFFGFYQYIEIRIQYFNEISDIDNITKLIEIKNTTQQRISGILVMN